MTKQTKDTFSLWCTRSTLFFCQRKRGVRKVLPTGSETNLGSLSDKSVLLDFATSQILLRTGSDRHQTFCHLLSEGGRERVENLETNKLKIHPAEKISKFVSFFFFKCIFVNKMGSGCLSGKKSRAIGRQRRKFFDETRSH